MYKWTMLTSINLVNLNDYLLEVTEPCKPWATSSCILQYCSTEQTRSTAYLQSKHLLHFISELRCDNAVIRLCSLLVFQNSITANPRSPPRFGSMLARRRRQWANIEPNLSGRLVGIMSFSQTGSPKNLKTVSLSLDLKGCYTPTSICLYEATLRYCLGPLKYQIAQTCYVTTYVSHNQTMFAL